MTSNQPTRVIKFRAYSDNLGMSKPTDFVDLVSSDTDFDEFDVYMQFTGLTDKNGKEIYEGDIVKASLLGDGKAHGYKDEIQFVGNGVIVIDPVHLMVNFKDGNRDNFYIYGAILHRETEVIGNIYENGDLL